MRVSIIVPVRDDPAIEDLLSSLARQAAAPAFEVVVALDGSRRIPTAPPGLVVRFVRLPPRGPYAARNAGASGSDGDVVLFTDSDSICPPDWVAGAVAAFEDPRLMALQGGSEALEGSRVSRWIQDEYARYVESHGALSHRRFCNTRCFGVRREVFDSNALPEDHERGGDGVYGMLLERRGIAIRYDPTWMVFHRHPRSRIDFARRVFRQGLDGARWLRTAKLDLFGFGNPSGSPRGWLGEGAVRSRPFALAASAAAAGAAALLGLATIGLPYRPGRRVFGLFARAAHLAGRLRGAAETR